MRQIPANSCFKMVIGAVSGKIQYKTPYVLDDGLPGILEVALSNDIAVNTVFGLPLQ